MSPRDISLAGEREGVEESAGVKGLMDSQHPLEERVHGRKAFAICAPEPTPNPSQEGNCRRASSGLLPSSEGLGVGRFMGRAGVRASVNHFFYAES